MIKRIVESQARPVSLKSDISVSWIHSLISARLRKCEESSLNEKVLCTSLSLNCCIAEIGKIYHLNWCFSCLFGIRLSGVSAPYTYVHMHKGCKNFRFAAFFLSICEILPSFGIKSEYYKKEYILIWLMKANRRKMQSN